MEAAARPPGVPDRRLGQVHRTDPAWVKTVVVATADTRPTALGQPFTRWNIRKLADYLSDKPDRRVQVGRE